MLPCLSTSQNRYVKHITDLEQDKQQWDEFISIMQTDKTFDEYAIEIELRYISAMYIEDAEPNTPAGHKYNPYEAPLKDTKHISMNYK